MGADKLTKTPNGDDGKAAKKLRKAVAASRADSEEIKKTLATLQEQVALIAKQPLPSMAGGALPPGIIEVSKRDDGQNADHMATASKSSTPAELAEIWKGMSPEERTMLAIQGSYMRPYTQRR